MEQEAKNVPKKKSTVLDDDQAVAAYAEFMGNGGSLYPDPKELEAERKKKEADEKAQKEL
jgi:hypothetical protein